VLKYDQENDRVTSVFKQKNPDPWSNIAEKYAVGTRVKGKVVSITDYGAFIELEPGLEGLAHVSEIGLVIPPQASLKIPFVGETVESWY